MATVKSGIYVRFSDSIMVMLQEQANETGVSVTKLVRAAVIEKLERDFGISLRD